MKRLIITVVVRLDGRPFVFADHMEIGCLASDICLWDADTVRYIYDSVCAEISYADLSATLATFDATVPGAWQYAGGLQIDVFHNEIVY